MSGVRNLGLGGRVLPFQLGGRVLPMHACMEAVVLSTRGLSPGCFHRSLVLVEPSTYSRWYCRAVSLDMSGLGLERDSPPLFTTGCRVRRKVIERFSKFSLEHE